MDLNYQRCEKLSIKYIKHRKTHMFTSPYYLSSSKHSLQTVSANGNLCL